MFISERNNLNTAHPWHGVSNGSDFPDYVTAYIEITPFDTVKYELDKLSGLLKIDRPQKYSNLCPVLYGFVPQTYCGTAIGNFCSQQTGKSNIIGDGDPLDICIISEKPIANNNILIDCIPIGGLRMIDKNEADDKIIAVLKGDFVFGEIRSIKDLQPNLLERILHYFKTYKLDPFNEGNVVEIAAVYDADEAKEVLRLSTIDYTNLILSKV